MRKTLILALLLMIAGQAWAGLVDESTARATAHRFLQDRVATGKLSTPAALDLKLVFTEVSSADGKTPVFYFYSSKGGFVIVSAEDRAQLVLAHGDAPVTDLTEMPEAMRYWLSCYKRQLEFLIANPDIQVSVPSSDAALRASQSVNPLITANWSQNAPYWNECPVYGTDTCYTGCPATSLAMVFHYWRYPSQQTPAVPSYISPSYAAVLPELPPTTFDWANMLNDYTGGYNDLQAAAVAHLMRYIGQAEEMDYTISGSGAYGKDVLQAVQLFEYDEGARLLFKNDDLGLVNYSDAQWGALIQDELIAGRPIVYCAYDNYTGAGHAFNVDGYDAGDDTYHINWGWNGRGNGFFALNAFTYNDYVFGTGQQMIIGIQPPEDYLNPRLQAYPLTLDLECYINRTAVGTVSLKGTNLTGDVILTLNDPSGAFGIDAAAIDKAVAEGGCDITVTYAPTSVGTSTATITCVSPDTDPVTITLNGNAPLEVYGPVMLPVNQARVTLTSFAADWTDNTPVGNVASYTLEVQAKPSYSLIEEADWSDLERMSPTNQVSHVADYLPEGWSFTGTEFNVEDGCICPRRNSKITTDVLDLTGYDKVTVEVTARAYGYYGDGSELTISTSKGSETLNYMYSYTTQTVVLDCDQMEQIVFTCGYYPMIRNIKIYAGDATQGASLRATETGNPNYRLVEGIALASRNYNVKDLTAGETFFYKVKALYIDGTESDWSNIEMVTLAEGGHPYDVGDMNHDGNVSITDVTTLINYLLSGGEVCPVCADVNVDGSITIADVTALINKLLTHN